MLPFVIFFTICTFQCAFTNDILSDEKLKSYLENLCPEVDICNRNASEPVVAPNGALDSRGYTSCCTGCSCHKDCHENINCCFPDEKRHVPKENQTTQGDIHTSDIDTEQSESVNRSTDVIDRGSVPIDTLFSTKQCLYARSGTPTEDWTRFEPAYRMVSKPPPGGCKGNSSSKLSIEENVPASCSWEPVGSWGNVFPVYSENNNLIFKNEQCARCHGVHTFKSWTPMLLCNEFDLAHDRFTSISEHFDFVRSEHLSKHCIMSFEYPDNAVLLTNRCYTNTVMTCHQGFQVPEEVDLTALEIRKACLSGLDAPVIAFSKVYRNAFCAICNSIYVSICLPKKNIGRALTKYEFLYLLDTSFLLRTQRASSKQKPKAVNPQACLHNGTTLVEESCRNVHCPSGQIRHVNGTCAFLSKRWYRNSFVLLVNLRYEAETETSILTMLNKGLVSQENIVKIFKKKSPWPAFFRIRQLIHSTDGKMDDYQSSIAVELITDITRPDFLIGTIGKSMQRIWSVALDGVRFSFQQSFLAYSLVKKDGVYKPWWRSFNLVTDIDMPHTASMNWTSIVTTSSQEIPFEIGKLLTCEQVSFFEDEYTLTANKYILVSKLANRVLFDKEFELVEDENGRFISRVCVQDTQFIIEMDTSIASKPSLAGSVVFALCLIDWALRLLDQEM